MDNEKAPPEEKVAETTQETTPAAGDHRIQFTQPVKPDRARASGKEDASTFVAPSRRSQSVGSITARHQSIVSIPPVLSEKQKARKQREEEEEKKHVDISEHLMSHEDVAEKYKTSISMGKPGESLGLTTQQAADLLLEHGPNILTPPSKRHWILKFWDCLSSLFNLLLILAGFLEYILLGIDFKDNFQNVSLTSTLGKYRKWYLI
jgi:sodium/potassium-transporting ATPase subunit alpha